ncbi:MAG: RNA polymerase sigma factor [Armatimonadota bacterium]
MLELVQKAQKGDRTALGRLVQDHYGRVFRFCARRVGDELGQDATQETFVTMQKTIDRFRADSRFETWLLGIAHHTCLGMARKARRDPMPLEDWFNPVGPDQSNVIERESLRQALATLSPEHREVVVMHEVEGLRYAEIAAILGVPEGTVKSRLHHAFLNLRQALRGGQK